MTLKNLNFATLETFDVVPTKILDEKPLRQNSKKLILFSDNVLNQFLGDERLLCKLNKSKQSTPFAVINMVHRVHSQ